MSMLTALDSQHKETEKANSLFDTALEGKRAGYAKELALVTRRVVSVEKALGM